MKALGIGAVFSRSKPIFVLFFFLQPRQMSDLALLSIKEQAQRQSGLGAEWDRSLI